MKLLDILESVGGAVVRSVIPGGGLLLDAINALLPSDKKLPAAATGTELRAAVDSLPLDQRAELMSREFDVQIEQHHTVRAMLQAEQASQHTTRPRIALGAFQVVAFVVMVAVSIWAYAVIAGDNTLVEVITEGWPFIEAVVAPFVALLWAYFGILKTEQRNRLDAISGTQSGVAGMISAVLKRHAK